MQGVLSGFAAIGVVIALGFALAHLRVLGPDSQLLLARLVFFVATPALLFRLVAQAEVATLFSSGLLVAAASAAVSALVYAVVARVVWGRDAAGTVVGALSSSYVNAGNLGLPIAAYVLGDGSWVAPILLLQLVVMAPLAFAVLDAAAAGRRPSVAGLVRQPFTNPITVAVLLGLVVAVTGWAVPAPVADPLALVGGMAVPGALLAYGVSLRLGPLPLAGGVAWEVALVTALKLVLQPVVAFLLGTYVFGLEGLPLLAVTTLAALPTAQNIFVYATRYERDDVLARDAIFSTTVLSVPVLLVVAAVLA